ncbi:MAG: M18 family aminopeptidase [Wujia sp.]
MQEFVNLLKKGSTQFHLVKECKDYLMKHGFTMVTTDSNFKPLPGGRYLVSPYPSMLVAVSMGTTVAPLRIAAAHTDFPMLKIKPQADVSKKGYRQLNIEPYGGLIKETWFDRPLGIAGKIVVKGDNPFKPQVMLFDSEKPIGIIPNLAPHLKKDSKNQEMDIQKEMLPIIACDNVADNVLKEQKLLDYISEKLSIAADSILDYDLYMYITTEPSILGLHDEFLNAARIDNISSVSAIMEAISSDIGKNCTAVAAFFDNEEVGSRSKQGADSFLLRDILRHFVAEDIISAAFSLSVDVAHATHPNYAEKSDITNEVYLGGGIVIKSSASQRYVTDSEAGAVVIALCQENGIKYMRQSNRSGMAGGQTLGPIMSSYLPVKSADIGIPMLAMHSAGELICHEDYKELVKLISAYYEA